jgi:hypothetical protein
MGRHTQTLNMDEREGVREGESKIERGSEGVRERERVK